jgi:predicted dehydrogenase
MNRQRPLRAVIVGAGLMGQWHADAVARAGGAVAAVVDGDRRRAARLAARHAGAAAWTELCAAPSTEMLDVVHLCTPSETHRRLATEALRSGLHVLVEKPVATTAEESAELLALASARGRLICPVHQFLFQPGVQRTHRAMRSIGPLVHVETRVCSAGAEGRVPEVRDGIVADILPHPLSLLARLLGPGLADVQWQVQCPRSGELRIAGTMNQTSLSVLVSLNGRPTNNSLLLIGSRGTIHADLYHGFAVHDRAKSSRLQKIAAPFRLSTGTFRAATVNLLRRAVAREIAYPGLRALVDRFYRAIKEEASSPIAAWEITAVALARDRVLAAWRKA